jgi:hypothetical protein
VLQCKTGTSGSTGKNDLLKNKDSWQNSKMHNKDRIVFQASQVKNETSVVMSCLLQRLTSSVDEH